MSKNQVADLKSELQKVRTELRDAHRIMLILYLIGAKAQKVAAEAGLDVAVDQDKIVDVITKFENGDITINFKEAAR